MIESIILPFLIKYYYIIIFWLAFSAIVGAYNYKTGGPFIVGFILAIIISPLLSALIISVIEPDIEVLEERKLKSKKFQRCPFCCELIKSSAIKCRFCNAELIHSINISSPPPKYTSLSTINQSKSVDIPLQQNNTNDISFNCSNCGQHLVVDNKAAGTNCVCPKCNHPLWIPHKTYK